jgi:hypothetical protein
MMGNPSPEGEGEFAGVLVVNASSDLGCHHFQTDPVPWAGPSMAGVSVP